jgi:hypothetical protein
MVSSTSVDKDAAMDSSQTTESSIFCRVFGYILRGLSEPRYPECGEAI